MTERQMQIFFEIHSGNPREGPGSFASTRKAFSFIKSLPDSPRILDVGCGPGAQTICLAQISKGEVWAVDNHAPFIEGIQKSAADLGLAGRVHATVADMTDLPFENESFDLVWAEGSIYIIGVEAGLEKWRPFLRKKGSIALTHLSWLRDDIPGDLNAFWQEAYPAIRPVFLNVAAIQDAGFGMTGQFTLPESDWWDNYYCPILEKLPAMRRKYADDPQATEVIQMEETEMDMYRRYSAWYGYVFYIAQKGRVATRD